MWIFTSILLVITSEMDYFHEINKNRFEQIFADYLCKSKSIKMIILMFQLVLSCLLFETSIHADYNESNAKPNIFLIYP